MSSQWNNQPSSTICWWVIFPHSRNSVCSMGGPPGHNRVPTTSGSIRGHNVANLRWVGWGFRASGPSNSCKAIDWNHSGWLLFYQRYLSIQVKYICDISHTTFPFPSKVHCTMTVKSSEHVTSYWEGSVLSFATHWGGPFLYSNKDISHLSTSSNKQHVKKYSA